MKKALILFPLLISFVCPVPSAAGRYDAVRIDSVQVRKAGNGEAGFRFRVHVPSGTLKLNDCLTLTPVLASGDSSLALPPVHIRGRVARRREIRRKVLHKESGPATGYELAVAGTFDYEAAVAYRPWMRTAMLSLRRQVRNCCSGYELEPFVLYRCDFPAPVPAPVLQAPPVHPEAAHSADSVLWREPFVHPLEDYRAGCRLVTHGEGAQVIYFKTSQAVIDETYFDNARILAHIVDVIRRIEASPRWQTGKIVLLGLASPEGTLDFNTRLAGGRAEALKRYLQERVSVPDSCFEVQNGSEGWEELRYMVACSDMPSREKVLRIIDTVPVREGREKQLMLLDRGDTYRYMLEHFFPALRRAGYIQLYIRKSE